MNIARTSPLYLTRFIAAYMVLLYHYGPNSWRIPLPALRHFNEPVNYFFFISGFVMIASSARYIRFNNGLVGFSKKDFWLKRIARIYPMYLLALFGFVLFNYTIREIDNSIPKRIWLELLGVHRWFYNGSINFPDWTVSCEFFFYLLFPFTLPWIIKKSLKQVTIITLILYISSIIISVGFKFIVPNILHSNNSAIVKIIIDSFLLHPFFRYTTFLFGCLCGRFYLESPKLIVIEQFSVHISIVCLVVISLLYTYDTVPSLTFEVGILCPIYFLFVLAICSLPANLTKALSWKPFIFLGEISYGIYIMQAPVEHYFQYLFIKDEPIATVWQFFVYTLFLIGICSILYYLFELPAKSFILQRFKPQLKIA